MRSSQLSYLVMLAIATAITTTKGTVEIVFPPYLASYGYSLSLIGLLTSLVAVLQLTSRVPTGLLYRANAAKRYYALALVVFGVTTAGFGLAQGQGLVLALLAAVHGFAFGALGTLGLAIAIDLSGGRRVGASMAWYTAAISTGYAIGYFLGGSLADPLGIPQTMLLIAVVPFIAAAGVFALGEISGAPHPVDRGAGLRGLLAAGARLDSRVWLAVVIVLYLNVLQDAVDTFFPVYGPAVGIALVTVGALRALKSGAGIFMRFAIALLLQALDYRRVTVIAVLLSAIGTILIPTTMSVLVLAIIFIVLGLCRGILRATSAANIAELRNEGRDVGLASGVYNMGLDVGGIVGPALGGAVASVVGIPAMFQLIAALAFVAFLLVALSTPSARQAAGLAKRHTIRPPERTEPASTDAVGGQRSG